ncbi:uncharacterized protein LOC141811919 [Curcuma longa]|uniref:uncharacterized protein LOC141811919 n=1 Tax=Curcuma longa TaxID=136217 RepID=UPI003D9ED9F0
MVMRRLCRKLDREDGLETVLEVPIPEEMFADDVNAGGEMRTWLNAQAFDNAAADDQHQHQQVSRRKSELQLLLNVVGLPLVPCPVPSDHAFGGRSLLLRDNSSIQESTAKYIIQQYIAATGGQAALTSISTMYAVGKVRMSASEFQGSDGDGPNEVGGYVLWQRSPDVWYFELIMAGCKMSAGSDGKLTWRQSASLQSHALRGPPRPLRRSLQGLDPRSTANLFSNDVVCTGEKTINGEECFMLKLDADRETLKARSAANFDMVHHTIWGYFSQRTGLLVQLDDTYLLSMKGAGAGGCGQTIFWETTMESALDDYRLVDGVSVAHAGRTTVTMSRYGEGTAKHKKRMEETWTIEEVDFNLLGLSMDCFLPPADMKKDQDGWQQ